MIFATIVIIIFWNVTIFSRQTFALMKMSLKPLDQDEYIHLSHTSSKDVFKTSCSRPIYFSWSYVFKTSAKISCQGAFKLFQDAFKTSCKNIFTAWRRLQDVFKTSSRCLAKLPARHLQEVFRTFSRGLPMMFSRGFQDVSSS